jgi:DNA-binding IclR family transcriptional regulator
MSSFSLCLFACPWQSVVKDLEAQLQELRSVEELNVGLQARVDTLESSCYALEVRGRQEVEVSATIILQNARDAFDERFMHFEKELVELQEALQEAQGHETEVSLMWLTVRRCIF